MPSLNSLMGGGDPYDFPYADVEDYECFEDDDDVTELTDHYFSDASIFNRVDDLDHEDRRKEWLENYAAEAAGFLEPDELPF